MVSDDGVSVSIMGVPVLSRETFAEHLTVVVPSPVSVPRFAGGAPLQAFPISEVAELGRRVNTDVAGVDCHVMLSVGSVDSASPVTRSQPVAARPLELTISMFEIVIVAVDPWSTV
jgi:hypothetical protein